MADFEETFKGLLGRYLARYNNCDVVSVLDYEQETEQMGYCETCWSEEEVVWVRYVDSKGVTQKSKIWSSLSYLIESLIELDKEAE